MNKLWCHRCDARLHVSTDVWRQEREAYGRSAVWADLRRNVFNRAQGRCELHNCNRLGDQIHHLHYENYGREKLDDLMLLCVEHHHQLHPGRHAVVSAPANDNQKQFSLFGVTFPA